MYHHRTRESRDVARGKVAAWPAGPRARVWSHMLGAPPRRAPLAPRALLLPRLPPPPSAGGALGRLRVAVRDASVVVGLDAAGRGAVEAAARLDAVAAWIYR